MERCDDLKTLFWLDLSLLMAEFLYEMIRCLDQINLVELVIFVLRKIEAHQISGCSVDVDCQLSEDAM